MKSKKIIFGTFYNGNIISTCGKYPDAVTFINISDNYIIYSLHSLCLHVIIK